MSEWFSTWFNSPYYHLLYKNRSEVEANLFVDNISIFLGINENHKVLDLACGKGRHSISLHQTGAEVWGLDIACESINYANKFSKERLKFEVHDMRNPIPHAPFDFVFNLFTSFGYFESEAEEAIAIENMAKALKPNGKLIIDFLNIEWVKSHLISYEEKEIEGITFKIEKEIKNGYILKNIRFENNGESFHFQEKVKALSLEDFKKYLYQAGLEIEKTFGNYNLIPHNSDTPRLILIASLKNI